MQISKSQSFFLIWIRIYLDLRNFQEQVLQPWISKVFSQSLEQFFLTLGQNNFENKIPFPIRVLHLVCTFVIAKNHAFYALSSLFNVWSRNKLVVQVQKLKYPCWPSIVLIKGFLRTTLYIKPAWSLIGLKCPFDTGYININFYYWQSCFYFMPIGRQRIHLVHEFKVNRCSKHTFSYTWIRNCYQVEKIEGFLAELSCL